MTEREKQRDRLVTVLAKHVLQEGLDQTSLRQLAAAAQTSDRMLLYYFKDKADLIAAVLMRLAQDLAAALDKALPEGKRYAPDALFGEAARLTSGRALRPYMRIWPEIIARAGRAEGPYDLVAEQIAAGFLTWIDQRLDRPEGPQRQALAAAMLAMIDGLSLMSVSACRHTQAGALGAMQNLLSD